LRGVHVGTEEGESYLDIDGRWRAASVTGQSPGALLKGVGPSLFIRAALTAGDWLARREGAVRWHRRQRETAFWRAVDTEDSRDAQVQTLVDKVSDVPTAAIIAPFRTHPFSPSLHSSPPSCK